MFRLTSTDIDETITETYKLNIVIRSTYINITSTKYSKNIYFLQHASKNGHIYVSSITETQNDPTAHTKSVSAENITA